MNTIKKTEYILDMKTQNLAIQLGQHMLGMQLPTPTYLLVSTASYRWQQNLSSTRWMDLEKNETLSLSYTIRMQLDWFTIHLQPRPPNTPNLCNNFDC
jgi:hypothetical protein